jgi:hypothetical protein
MKSRRAFSSSMPAPPSRCRSCSTDDGEEYLAGILRGKDRFPGKSAHVKGFLTADAASRIFLPIRRSRSAGRRRSRKFCRRTIRKPPPTPVRVSRRGAGLSRRRVWPAALWFYVSGRKACLSAGREDGTSRRRC